MIANALARDFELTGFRDSDACRLQISDEQKVLLMCPEGWQNIKSCISEISRDYLTECAMCK
jgi:hypothetical protein